MPWNRSVLNLGVAGRCHSKRRQIPGRRDASRTVFICFYRCPSLFLPSWRQPGWSWDSIICPQVTDIGIRSHGIYIYGKGPDVVLLSFSHCCLWKIRETISGILNWPKKTEKQDQRRKEDTPPTPHLLQSELSRWDGFGYWQSILWNFRIESQGIWVAESWRIPSFLCHFSNHNRTRKEIASEHLYNLLVLDLWAVSFLTKVCITFDQKMGALEFIKFLFLLCLAGISESTQNSLLMSVSPLISNATFSCLKFPSLLFWPGT